MTYPKILIVSRLNWDDNSVSNTLTNLFCDYDPDKIARIYIETKLPNTRCCHLFFRISEFSLIKKLWHWRLNTGDIITDVCDTNNLAGNDSTARQELAVMNWVRGHRSILFTVFRDILWSFGGWKSKELKRFILNFDPDVVWLDGSPLIFMNRLNKYVFNVARKPSVTFLMDDVYCYESCSGIFDRAYKFFLRKHVKETVGNCRHVFVSSPKMKIEYDRIFGINSTFISKSFDVNSINAICNAIHYPVKLVYLGNVLIGRLKSLISIAECIKEINLNSQKIQLSIYTNSLVTENDKKRLLCDKGINIYPPVSFDKVPGIIANNDVLVFVEAMDGHNKSVARLSFSTKIVDYIQSGKCILAVGPYDVAPIEYFRSEDAAIVATDKTELKHCLMKLTDENIINEYAQKAFLCGKRNHDSRVMHNTIYSIIKRVASEYND